MVARSSNNKLLSIYLIIGEDDLKINHVLKRLNTRLEEFGDISFNTNKFNADSCSATDIVQACQQVPFISEKRLVLVKDLDKMSVSEHPVLVNYIENPCDFTILVFVSLKLSKNTKLYKSIRKYNPTSIIECNLPKKYNFVSTVEKIARANGTSISLNACKKLVDIVGENTTRIDKEIKKIVLLNGRKQIEVDDITLNVAKTNSSKPWDFTNAFGSRNLNLCLQMLNMLDKGSEFILLSLVYRLVKELICVKEIKGAVNQYTISKTLNCESWKVKNHSIWVNNFTLAELIAIFNNAINCEMKIKSSSDSLSIFKEFVIDSLSK